MAVRKIEMQEFTCDGCGKMQLVEDTMELIGISGNAWSQTALGGSGEFTWFACSLKCVGKSVKNALDREYEK